jgi:hypothetical protein
LSGGTFTAGPRGLRFKPDDSHKRESIWQRGELFAVEAHRISINRSTKWELSVRFRNGKRHSLLRGHQEPMLKELAQDLNSALAIPSAAERVTRALAALALAPRPGEESIPDAGDLSQQANPDRVVAYAPSPQDDAIYRSSREGLQIILPCAGWTKVTSAYGFLRGIVILCGNAVVCALVITRSRRLRPLPFFAIPFAIIGLHSMFWAIYACLTRSVIDIDAEAVQLHIERPWLPSATRRWNCDQIIDVRTAESGIALELIDGETMTIVSTPRVADAREYAKRMREALGLPP